MVKRVYFCHTFYHAYVACVKELLIAGESDGADRADLVLSTMSNDWGEFPERIRAKGLFREFFFYEEQTGAEDRELQALHRDRGNLFLNLLQRVRYTKRLGKLQENYMPVDPGSYDEVNVFCDSDPIGYYLNYRKIPYHAIEDGLNSGKLDNQAMLSNRGAFRLKTLLAKLGLIFIECGYSRYCIDYEVNDLSANFRPPKNAVEVPRMALYERLSAADHAFLAEVFLPDAAGLTAVMERCTRPVAMILTEPLCELSVRERLFADVIGRYLADYDVILKPHPRDTLDYERCYRERFPGIHVLTGCFPMEVLDDLESFRIRKLVSVITQVDDSRFAEEMDYLGSDFLDAYEDPAIHRKMERLIAAESGEKTASDRKTGNDADAAEMQMLRPATPKDRDWWLNVRNDAETRQQSFQSGEIDPETHARWFAAKLADPSERLYVLEEAGKPVAQLRLTAADPAEEPLMVEISYAVAQEARGKGVGGRLIRMAAGAAREAFLTDAEKTAGRRLRLIASVKTGNEASRRIFGAAGFLEEAAGEEEVRYVMMTE